MTLFFDWKNLDKESKGSPAELVKLLKDFRSTKILKPGLRNKLKGSSFLLQPSSLLGDKTTDILYIYQYILLAAKRDYLLYKLYGLKSLPLSHYPDINIDSIKHNPLLLINNNELKFKHEE